MEKDPADPSRRTIRWLWFIIVLAALAVILYLVLDAIAGTHGV